MDKVVVIIPAAGSGKRMQSSVNKQFLEIGGMTVIERTLRAFENAGRVSEIIVVTKLDEIDAVKDLITRTGINKVRCVVEGGAERQDSISNGIKNTNEDDHWILVHDGARPFVTSECIDDMIEKLIEMNTEHTPEKSRSLIMAVPSKDTIKQVVGDTVKETLNRAELWNVQTPQAFSRSIIVSAYKKAFEAGFTGTDDASLVEWIGLPVDVHMGSYENIKITTPDDIYLGEAILKKRGEV